MKIKFIRARIGGLLGLAVVTGGCVAPPPVEVVVTVREAGICCQASKLVECRDRTAEIKEAFADPDQLHHTVPELGTLDRDRPTTTEHDRGSTIEHDRGDTIEHDLLRCRLRNNQLREALYECHQALNECKQARGANCASNYEACYNEAVAASPFGQ